MGYSNGVYTRDHNFSADASAGINILAARMDTELDDLASALTNVVWTRDGATTPTANIPLGGKRFINVGAPVSVNNYIRSREFIENVPIFMQDTASSADRISVSSQYFTSVSANQAPGDGTKIIIRTLSNKSSAVLYVDGHSANIEYQDGNRIAAALVSGGIYEFVYSSVDTAWKVTDPDDGRTSAEIAAGVTPTNYQYPESDIRRYGGVGDGVADDTTALVDAIAVGKPVLLPYGNYKIVGSITIAEGGLIGEGWGTASDAQRSRLWFYNCTDTSNGAVNTRQAVTKNGKVLLENVEIRSSSWDGTTGCLGYGLDIEASVIARNVYVNGFKKSNVWLHHDNSSIGPYNSQFDNLMSVFSGQHGVLVGNGANVLLFNQLYSAWNGAPSYGVAPSVAGSYDGFQIAETSDGGTYPNYTPNSVTVIGGNCSYNSRYGWNIDTTDGSMLLPGYAEGNLTNQARIGNVFNTQLCFQHLNGNTSGLTNAQVFSPYFYRNSVWIGGKRVHPANVYEFIANPTAEDESSGTIQNAPTRQIFLSRSDDATYLTYFFANKDPAGGSATVATETILSLTGAGANYAIGLGSGSRHLEVRNNKIILPDIYYQKLTIGWNTGDEVSRSVGTAAPVAGTWKRGDILWNSQPSAGGTPGWMCVTAGTPGTWKAMANLAA